MNERRKPQPRLSSGEASAGWRGPVGERQPIGMPRYSADEQIEAAIDRDPEAEAGAGAELEHAHAALRPVGELEQLDARDLRERAGALRDLGSRPAAPEQFDHACLPACCGRSAALALQP